MNKMRIPRILRALTWISIPVFVISLAVTLWLYNKQPADLPIWLEQQYSLLNSVLTILFMVSFVLMLTAHTSSLAFDWILNGLLCRFGKPATATILAKHNTGISTSRLSHIWRIKLQVQPADSEAFEAITEQYGGSGKPGERVQVRYDPLTKSVAIYNPMTGYQARRDHENF